MKTKINISLKKEDKKFRDEMVSAMAESFYRYGLLTEKDFEDKKELGKKIKKLLSSRRGGKLSLVIDHKDSILKKAQICIQEKEFDYAYMFYAIYFEHLINDVIYTKCLKEKIPNSTYKELIRRVSLEDKFSWVLNIIKLSKFNDKHYKTIKMITDKRNSFIHYKYQPEPLEKPIDSNKLEWEKHKKSIEKAVIYCKTYCTRVLYLGKSSKMKL